MVSRRRRVLDLATDTGDRDADSSRPCLQDTLDGHRGALIDGVSPETAEGDEDRRRERDKGGEPQRTHRVIVSTTPDGYCASAC